MIHQGGWGASASVEQGGSYYSRAEIVQHSADGHNMADIWQSGNANQAMVYQHSGGNQASIRQGGDNLSASISQHSGGYGYGQGNSATIRQGY